MRSRMGPPNSSYTGTPSALPLMSHNASSMPAMALKDTPPKFCRVARSMSQYRRSTGRGSWPTSRGTRSRTLPAMPYGLRLSLHSPQPTRPVSVSMRTKVHGRQPPSACSASTRAIFMETLRPTSMHGRPRVCQPISRGKRRELCARRSGRRARLGNPGRGSIVYRPAHGEGAPQARLELLEGGVGPGAHRVEELAEEASRGGGGGHVEDLLVPIAVRAQHLDVGGGDLLRAPSHLLREGHEGALARLQWRLGGVGGAGRHGGRIEDLGGEHAAVGEGAVRGPEGAGSGEGGELVAPHRQVALHGAQQGRPAVQHARPEAEGLGPVGHVAEATLRLLVHLAHGSLRIRRRYGANERHGVSSDRDGQRDR